MRCPGLFWDKDKKKAVIDEVICAGCGVCASMCPTNAISERRRPEEDSGRLAKDPFNIIITGVGGQGNVMASRILSNMLVRRGYQVTIGETFGFPTGGVGHEPYSRLGRFQWSPQIPKGKADMVVTLEPIEAIRVLMNYGNPEVKVLTNTRPIYPVGVISGELNYPTSEEIQEASDSCPPGPGLSRLRMRR